MLQVEIAEFGWLDLSNSQNPNKFQTSTTTSSTSCTCCWYLSLSTPLKNHKAMNMHLSLMVFTRKKREFHMAMFISALYLFGIPPPNTPVGLCNAFCSEVCFSSLDVDFVEVVCPTELGAAPRGDSSKSLQNALHNPISFKPISKMAPEFSSTKSQTKMRA